MKRLLIVAAFAATSACRHDVHVRAPATTDFYGELSPYGEWVTVAPYGSVWRPAVNVVGPDFYPYYTGGWWVNTQYGWTWQSTFSWGWIPFHHGRWITTQPYGWVWVPGDEWAPAWVEWRVGGGNVGWVPLGPQGVASAFPNYHPRWCFVPLPRFGRQNFHHARLPPHQEYVAYRAATAIPFQRGDWRRGPSPELVQRAGGEVPIASLPSPRRLRPGDVRGEQRVGPATLPPAPPVQARTPQPEPGLRRAPPPPGAPLAPPSAGGDFRRAPPPPGAPLPPPSAPAGGDFRRPPPPPGAPMPPMSMPQRGEPRRSPPPPGARMAPFGAPPVGAPAPMTPPARLERHPSYGPPPARSAPPQPSGSRRRPPGR